jgi:hypothetical protein
MFCDELTGDFGNGLEATSVGDCGTFGLHLREIDRHFGSFATVSALFGLGAMSD